MEEVFIPPTPESPAPHRIRRPHRPSPLLSEPGRTQPFRSASSPLFDAVWHHHARPCKMDEQTSFPSLTTPVSPDESTPELISNLDMEGMFVAPKSVTTSSSQAGTNSDHRVDADGDKSQCFGLPADFRPTCGPGQGISDIKLLDLTVWGPDSLAEQLCVLMHTLYATIRQNDCLDWMKGRRSTDVTGLRYFLDIHDYIASWVQKSILAYDDMTRQIKTLDFWIRVAEVIGPSFFDRRQVNLSTVWQECHALRNFDSLCAIILTLSGSSLSPLVSTWERCTHKKTFTALHNMLDVANKFCCFMDSMDAATGPSVPFVRTYLDHIKELHIEHPNSSPHQKAADARSSLAAVSTLLRHQSSPYDFKITKPIRSFIDDQLQTVRLANGWPLAWSCDIQHREQSN